MAENKRITAKICNEGAGNPRAISNGLTFTGLRQLTKIPDCKNRKFRETKVETGYDYSCPVCGLDTTTYDFDEAHPNWAVAVSVAIWKED